MARKPAGGQCAQQELFRRGGKRCGAGRKPTGKRAGEQHAARPEFKACHPLHVVMRVVPEVRSLRRRKIYQAVRDATITAALRERIRIVHISLQRSHVHLLVEADSKAALARGMQGFVISAARHINTALEDQPWMWPIRETYDPMVVRRPQSWLLREGWMRAGGAFSARDVPGPRR
jgi:REP element-mobilizing transposase RayT